MADQKKMKSGTFHRDLGPMDQEENYESNSSWDELHAESPAQIGKDETPCESISVSPKELPSSKYRENLSASPKYSSSNIEKQSEAPRFVPAATIQEVT